MGQNVQIFEEVIFFFQAMYNIKTEKQFWQMPAYQHQTDLS